MANAAIGMVDQPKRRNALADFFTRLVKEKPLGTLGAVITLIFFACAVFSEFLAPYGFNEIGVGERLSGSSWQHPMGVDQLGRDVLSRIIFGARISVIIGLAAACFSIIVSTALGTLSGFLGGKVDLVVQRFVDAWISFPGLLVLIVMVTIVGPGVWQIVVVLGVLYGIGGSRIVQKRRSRHQGERLLPRRPGHRHPDSKNARLARPAQHHGPGDRPLHDARAQHDTLRSHTELPRTGHTST